ncbi:hypothetical protein F5B20DRAFT_581474 [Whalleya microplaca]|nr:hypothetical protein F5B20DRAFT_581474 [Whalleya microplaca]
MRIAFFHLALETSLNLSISILTQGCYISIDDGYAAACRDGTWAIEALHISAVIITRTRAPLGFMGRHNLFKDMTHTIGPVHNGPVNRLRALRVLNFSNCPSLPVL